MNAFDYHRPTTLKDAAALMRAGADARFLAGGQSLLPTMKLGLASPSELIDLAGISELKGIERRGDVLRIGASTTHSNVAASSEVRACIPALAALADGIGDRQVRNRGTLGGSLANNDPAACYPSAVLALGATVHTARRDIAADDFFQGLYTTALEADEIITAVSFPIPLNAAYVKFHQPASHFALVGVFVARFARRARVAATGAANSVFRVPELEAALSSSWAPQAARSIRIDDANLNSDLHASAAYRAHLIPVLAARGVEQSV
jgi:carbon-monoxide dehydrogenase medium subunit